MQILKKISSHRLKFALIIFSTFFLSAQRTSLEYQVKAAFIFNFTQFVEWPAQCFSSPQSPVVIGILGKNPFSNYLEETIAGEAIDKHPLIIKQFNSVDEITNNCHILFINVSDKIQLQEIITKLKGKNVLTVSDTPGFPRQGGMVRLYTKDDKINIQINLEATKAENLIVSSKLLKLSEIVKTAEK